MAPDWNTKLTSAQEMLPLLYNLHHNNNIITSIFGRILMGVTDIDIVKAHRYSRLATDTELTPAQTLPIVQALAKLTPTSASIDIGTLAVRYAERSSDNHGEPEDLEAFLRTELAEVLPADTVNDQGNPASATPPRDIVLYGFGRIGRLLARILISREAAFGSVKLRAVVVRKNGDNDLQKRASLLRRDSVHGAFNGTITVDEEHNVIWANGTKIQIIYSNDPASVDYTSYGITDAIVVDNTGRWRDEAGLQQHLKATGCSRVVLTAPGKGDLKNVVYGINHTDITPDNDQNLIDNFHRGSRRGRAAGLNMVLTETGAAKAVAKALPELAGKLTGNAIRVPTPDVSMAVLNLTLDKEVTREEVNDLMDRVALYSDLRQQIAYIHSPEVVSTDFVGTTHAGIIDGLATIANGNHLVLYVWYDNEFGYSNQVIRIVEELAQARPLVLPRRINQAEL